jgi:hypothetical protein
MLLLQVHDAVFEAITKGWMPPTVSPACDITYLDKIKAPQKGSRMSLRMNK